MSDISPTSPRGILRTLGGFFAVIAFLLVVFYFARSVDTGETNDIVLYYGDGCPHCALVDAFIKDNNVEEKVQFVRKEVYNNKRNAREMASFAKQCSLPTDNIGIPFLWTGTTCVTGDQDIMKFFESAVRSTQ